MNTKATFPTYRDARIARIEAVAAGSIRLSEVQIHKHGPYGYEFGSQDLETHYTITATPSDGANDFDLCEDGLFHGRA